MHVLLTGRPGVGKTTLIRKVIDAVGASRCGGFYTGEIREGGIRVGFGIETLDGKTGVLAHIRMQSHYQVSKYKVNLKDLEAVGVMSVEEALKSRDIVVIDEIGKMELFSQRFRDVVRKALGSKKKVLATIHMHSHPFTDEIRRRGDVRVIEVTIENRDTLVKEIIRLLS